MCISDKQTDKLRAKLTEKELSANILSVVVHLPQIKLLCNLTTKEHKQCRNDQQPSQDQRLPTRPRKRQEKKSIERSVHVIILRWR